MAQTWLSGEATSIREGCRKNEPKGGDVESVTPGLVSGWAITGIGFDAEAADAFLLHSKHGVAFLVSNHFSAGLQTLGLGLPMVSAQGLRCCGCSLGRLHVLAVSSLTSKLQLPSPCELPELAMELPLLVFFSWPSLNMPQRLPSKCRMSIMVLPAPWDVPSAGMLVSSRHLQHLGAPVPGFVSREPPQEHGPIATGSLNVWLPQGEIWFSKLC